MKYDKDEILKLKSLEDLIQYEDKLYEEVRNDYYNTILKDKDIEKHLLKILKTDRNEIENLLMINGSPPIDIDLDFERDFNYSELDEDSSLSKLISTLWDVAMKEKDD